MDDSSPAPHPFYDAIGRVTAEAVGVEQTLLELLRFLERSPTLEAWFNAAPFHDLIELTRVAIRAHNLAGPKASELTSLLNRTDELRLRRNNVVHSFWTFGTDGQGQPVYLGHKPERRRLGLRTATSGAVREIREVAAEMYVLRQDLWHFVGSLLVSPDDELPPFPISAEGKEVNPHGHTPDGRSITIDEAKEQGIPIPPELGPDADQS